MTWGYCFWLKLGVNLTKVNIGKLFSVSNWCLCTILAPGYGRNLSSNLSDLLQATSCTGCDPRLTERQFPQPLSHPSHRQFGQRVVAWRRGSGLCLARTTWGPGLGPKELGWPSALGRGMASTSWRWISTFKDQSLWWHTLHKENEIALCWSECHRSRLTCAFTQRPKNQIELSNQVELN